MDELVTMLACMAAFHGLLGHAARGGRVRQRRRDRRGRPRLARARDRERGGVRRSGRSCRALPSLEAAYRDAGVRRSMVWVPPGDERAPEVLREAGYALDAEAPAMSLDLARLPTEDDPLDDWTDDPLPTTSPRSSSAASGFPTAPSARRSTAGSCARRRTSHGSTGGRRRASRSSGRAPTRASSWSARFPRPAAAGSRAGSCCGAAGRARRRLDRLHAAVEPPRLSGVPAARLRRVGGLGMWERSR